MNLKDEYLKVIQSYYKGFTIHEAVGNNAFSFDQRLVKEIYVPKLIRGGLDNLAVSNTTAFCEIDGGQEFSLKGLKNFIYYLCRDKNIFIFDNHNHAFFFWWVGFLGELIHRPMHLVHVDQHTDMRDPLYYLSIKEEGLQALEKVFNYTNNVLNVGNFVKPAVSLGFFNHVDQITGEDGFYKDFKEPFVLDIDMDVFSPSMEYISQKLKVEKIRRWIEQSSWITIATSPYFMDQNKAIDLIKQLLE